MPTTPTPETCSHCRRPMRGSASASGQPLCHPSYGLDCYRLVTIYGHAIPCRTCADVRITLDLTNHPDLDSPR